MIVEGWGGDEEDLKVFRDRDFYSEDVDDEDMDFVVIPCS